MVSSFVSAFTGAAMMTVWARSQDARHITFWMSYLPPEQLLHFVDHILLQTDSTSVTSFVNWTFRQHSCLFPSFFIEPTISPLFRFLTNWSVFIPTFLLHAACLSSFRVLFLLYFAFVSHSALSALFSANIFKNCDSSFSIFRHALQTFSTFDAFQIFFNFYFYMIFLLYMV